MFLRAHGIFHPRYENRGEKTAINFAIKLPENKRKIADFLGVGKCGDGYEKTAESLENTGFSAVSSLARRKGFEPLTFWSVARHSIQLS